MNASLVELVAKAIEGPWDLQQAFDKERLDALRQERWQMLSANEKANRCAQANAAIRAIEALKQ